MSLGLQLILSTTLVAAPPGCSWAHPGANPYRGDPVAALADFGLTDEQRTRIAARMRARQPTDVVTISRDDIVSRSGPAGYADLREMHSGGGQVCHGEVDRSAWSTKRRERALVYCADDACVIVPAICNNVSLASRKPDRQAVLDESPIDIEPAAGPRPSPQDTPSSGPPTDGPLAFIPTPDSPGGGDGTPVAPPGEGGGVPIGGGGGMPGGSGGAPGGGGGGGPIGAGHPPCCGTGPIGPGGPSPVPEPPIAPLLVAGLAMLWRRTRAHPECR